MHPDASPDDLRAGNRRLLDERNPDRRHRADSPSHAQMGPSEGRVPWRRRGEPPALLHAAPAVENLITIRFQDETNPFPHAGPQQPKGPPLSNSLLQRRRGGAKPVLTRWLASAATEIPTGSSPHSFGGQGWGEEAVSRN